MVSSKCFVPGCKTGNLSDRIRCKKEGKRVCSIFLSPRDPTLFEKWKSAMPKSKRELTRESSICELHFLPEELEKFYVTKLKDGSESRIKRGRITLKPDAVPSIFSNSPEYLRNTPKKKNPDIIINVKEKDYVGNAELKKMQIENVQETEEGFTYDKALENLLLIKKPNHWWGITSTDKFIICAKWNDQFNTERKVVIARDLTMRVFLRDCQFEVVNNAEFTCIDDISTLLKRVDFFKICEGANKHNMNCLVCLPERTQAKGRIKRWCIKCALERKQLLNASRNRNFKRPVLNNNQLRQKVVDAQRKSYRMKQKMERLNQKMKDYKKMSLDAKAEAVTEAICNLPPSLQKSVKACLGNKYRKRRSLINSHPSWGNELLSSSTEEELAEPLLQQLELEQQAAAECANSYEECSKNAE